MECTTRSFRAGLGNTECKQDPLEDDGRPSSPDPGGPYDPNDEKPNNPNPNPVGGPVGAGGNCPNAVPGTASDPCNPFGNGVENGEDDVIVQQPGSGEPATFPVDNDSEDDDDDIDNDGVINIIDGDDDDDGILDAEDPDDDNDGVLDVDELDDVDNVTGDPDSTTYDNNDDEDDGNPGDPNNEFEDDPGVYDEEDTFIVVDLATCFGDCDTHYLDGPEREQCKRHCKREYDIDGDGNDDLEFQGCFKRCKGKGFDDPSDELTICFNNCRDPEEVEFESCFAKCDDMGYGDSEELDACFDSCRNGDGPIEPGEAFPVDDPDPDPVDDPDPDPVDPIVPDPIGELDPLEFFQPGGFPDLGSCDAACDRKFADGLIDSVVLQRCKEEKCAKAFPPPEPVEPVEPVVEPIVDPKCGEEGFKYPDGWVVIGDGKILAPDDAIDPHTAEPYVDKIIELEDFCNPKADTTSYPPGSSGPGLPVTTYIDPVTGEYCDPPDKPCGSVDVDPVVDPVDPVVVQPGETEPLPPRDEPIQLTEPAQSAVFDCTNKSCVENRASAEAGFARLNEHRVLAGRAPLKWNEMLYRACLDNANYQCSNRVLVHNQPHPDGDPLHAQSTMGSRAQDAGYYAGSGFPDHVYNQVTENGGANSGGSGIGMVDDWLAELPPDDGHKKNSLNSKIVDGAMAVVGCYGTWLGGGGNGSTGTIIE